MPVTMLSVLHAFIHLILTANLLIQCCVDPHIIAKEVKTKEGYVICQACRPTMRKPGFVSGSLFHYPPPLILGQLIWVIP